MKKKNPNRTFFLFILLTLLPAALPAQKSIEAGIPFTVQGDTLSLSKTFFKGPTVKAVTGGRILHVAEDEGFFHVSLPLYTASPGEVRVISSNVSFSLLLEKDDLPLGFVDFPRECIQGVASLVEITPSVPLEKLEIRRDGEPVSLYRGRNNQILFYLAYPLLTRQKESRLVITAVTRNGGIRTQSVSVRVQEGLYKKERLTLGAVYTGNDGLESIRPALLEYENKKVARLLASKSGRLSRSLPAFLEPVAGRITSPFGIIRSYNGRGYRTYHTGIDIGGNPSGTPVTAPLGGEVLCAEDFYGRGLTVILDHGYGVKSLYYHLDRLAVTAGDEVVQGDILGDVGTTGFSTGPHLHWEVRVNNIPVDPLRFP